MVTMRLPLRRLCSGWTLPGELLLVFGRPVGWEVVAGWAVEVSLVYQQVELKFGEGGAAVQPRETRQGCGVLVGRTETGRD